MKNGLKNQVGSDKATLRARIESQAKTIIGKAKQITTLTSKVDATNSKYETIIKRKRP